MNFTVLFRNRCDQQVAGYYIQARESGHDLKQFNEALDRLEAILGEDPENAGESREFGERIIFEPPFVARFEVFNDNGTVIVLDVRYLPHEPS